VTNPLTNIIFYIILLKDIATRVTREKFANLLTELDYRRSELP